MSTTASPCRIFALHAYRKCKHSFRGLIPRFVRSNSGDPNYCILLSDRKTDGIRVGSFKLRGCKQSPTLRLWVRQMVNIVRVAIGTPRYVIPGSLGSIGPVQGEGFTKRTATQKKTCVKSRRKEVTTTSAMEARESAVIGHRATLLNKLCSVCLVSDLL